MTTLAMHIDHRVQPGEHRNVATAVGEILQRPCFSSLTRVWINVKDRDKKHQPKSVKSVVECLLAPDSDAAVLDNGRAGDLVASARIWTGRHIRDYDEPWPFLGSYVVIPYDAAQREAIIDGFADLAAALQAVAGYVAVERDHDRAHRAALSQAPKREDVRDFPRRAQERKAHFWYEKNVGSQISGPDWGLILGPEHLKLIDPDPAVFEIIRDAGPRKLVFLSSNPDDALREEFEAHLDKARSALAPALMDVSAVPVS